MGKVILSAFADEYNRDLDAQIKMCRQHQLSRLEPRFVGDRNIADLSAKEARQLRKKLGEIRISAIGSPLGKINLAEDFERHLEKARRVFDTANILETRNVRMFSFYLREGQTRQECRGEVLDKLGRMLDLADRFGVILCHENEAEIYGESPARCRDILDVFDGRMKCVFDMGNFVLGGWDPYREAYPLLKRYIEYFHIKDALAEGAVVPPGCGEGHIQEILADYCAASGREVILTLEPHLYIFSGLDQLADRKFENPYRYETSEEAFLDALSRLRKLLGEAEWN